MVDPLVVKPCVYLVPQKEVFLGELAVVSLPSCSLIVDRVLQTGVIVDMVCRSDSCRFDTGTLICPLVVSIEVAAENRKW
jgi:hypothetical protein